jgi:hypothetical protein
MYEAVSVVAWHPHKLGSQLKRLFYRASFDGFRHCFLRVSCGPYQSHKNRGIKQSPLAEPHGGGRHTYDGVLPGAPEGSCAAPQSYAAFGTMPHTPWLQWTEPCMPFYDVNCLRRGRLGLAIEGIQYINICKQQQQIEMFCDEIWRVIVVLYTVLLCPQCD